MKTLVAGATGATGQRIVRELIRRGIPTRAMVRDVELARTTLPPEAEIVRGDVLKTASLEALLDGCTVLICATGARPGADPTAPFLVDYQGTKNLVNAAKNRGIQHFVLVSSLCVSQFFHPLNLFFLILVWKKWAEDYLQKSGLTYTIVRPGGLLNTDNEEAIAMAGADTLFGGRIPRSKVAQVCVEALFQPAAQNKIVEIITTPDTPTRSFEELFAGVR